MSEETSFKKYSALQNILYVLKGVWLHDKGIFYFFVANTILAALIPFVGVYAPKLFIDELTGAQRVDYLIILIAAVTVALAVARWGTIRIYAVCMWRFVAIRFKFIDEINLKRLTMDFHHTENTKTLDRFKNIWMAFGNTENGIEGVIRRIFNLGGTLLAIGSYVVIVSAFSPLVLLYLVVNMAITFYFTIRAKAFEEGKRDDAAALNRRRDYVYNTMYNFEYGKDIRLYGMGNWLSSLFERFRLEGFNLDKKIQRKYLTRGIIEGILLLIREGLVYLYLIYLALTKGISIGDFALYLGAIGGFAGLMNTAFENVAHILAQNIAINNFREFLELPDMEEITNPLPIPDKSTPFTIEFDKVSFAYPGGKNIFTELSFKLEAGKRLAVVGVNGAGKTTLVKLLTRLYEPTSGRILLNGVDIALYNRKEYQRLLGPVFQEIKIFAMTMAENVALKPNDQINRDRVNQVLKQSGLSGKLSGLESGIDTSLLKILDEGGIELSGGENQRLALARALYKDAPIMLLDEPTSALDPLAEYEMYQNFDKIIGNKTAIYISHRLASTRFCDYVAFFENGEILEWGSHDELTAKNGRYAEMFKVQAQYYQEGEVMLA